MSEECGVVVGVRVRPYLPREKDLNAQLCIEMQGPNTIITSPTGEEKTFAFDESFWSFDGFDQDEKTGYCRPSSGSKYADQTYVFNKFGKTVLDNAWEGYHTCLFAYGQTGAGKSYSMVGYGANKGIVPVSCEEIFIRIGANKDPNLRYEVTTSMVEIYNEAIQDLLMGPQSRTKKGLEIHENKMLGVYIEGVTKLPVESYEAISRAVAEGSDNRTVGSTRMNATSSRAHTVLIIEFKQVELIDGKEATKLSMINLVDLAGSEKAGQTGAEGARFKEGVEINKSLTTLGNVIEKLAERSSAKPAKQKQMVIPYRNSKLTRLLQNALGGSSKTIMICALSPASSNYEESLSTLRYADRAKKIKNTAVVNENPQDRILRELREENEKLRQMMNRTGVSVDGGSNEAAMEEIREKEDEIARTQAALNEMQRSFAEKLVEAKENQLGRRATGRISCLNSHLSNLNIEKSLTGKIRYPLMEGKVTRIGAQVWDDSDGEDSVCSLLASEPEEDPPDIILTGEGTCRNHAEIETLDGICYLRPTEHGATETFLNGECLKGRELEGPEDDVKIGIVLNHADRVCFGREIFVFVNPNATGCLGGLGSIDLLVISGQVTYKKARRELEAHNPDSYLWGKEKRFSVKQAAREEQAERRATLSLTLSRELIRTMTKRENEEAEDEEVEEINVQAADVQAALDAEEGSVSSCSTERAVGPILEETRKARETRERTLQEEEQVLDEIRLKQEALWAKDLELEKLREREAEAASRALKDSQPSTSASRPAERKQGAEVANLASMRRDHKALVQKANNSLSEAMHALENLESHITKPGASYDFPI